jgi:hypothetical protein
MIGTVATNLFHERIKTMFTKERYYEPKDNNSDLIDDRVSELMKDEYNPTQYSNFAEGISEANEKDREAVELILQQSEIDYEALGRKLFCMAYDYMEGYANSHAEANLSSGYLD